MLQERREQLHNNLLPILDAILVHALNAIPSCPIVMTRLIIILVIKRVSREETGITVTSFFASRFLMISFVSYWHSFDSCHNFVICGI